VALCLSTYYIENLSIEILKNNRRNGRLQKEFHISKDSYACSGAIMNEFNLDFPKKFWKLKRLYVNVTNTKGLPI